MSIDDLKQKYALTTQRKERIQNRIIKDYARSATSQQQPIVVILGGQPGAGKSELTVHALQLLNNNAVICNADEYRNYHPQFKEIATLYQSEYPEITAEYSKPWNDGLKGYCETHRFNYILETTFSSGDAMNKTIVDLKAKGYLVYLMLIAIPAYISLIGTYFRFEDARKRKGYGRLVGKAEHDKRYSSLPETLKIVQEAQLYNQLFIFARHLRVSIHSNQQARVVLKARNPVDPLSSYLKLRDKAPNAIDKTSYRKNYELIIQLMQERNATSEEIDRFRAEVPSSIII